MACSARLKQDVELKLSAVFPRYTLYYSKAFKILELLPVVRDKKAVPCTLVEI